MMARMLMQAPLPWLPAGAAEIAPGVGVERGGAGGVVWVHGLATFAWDAGDEASRRLAAVQLVRLRAATQRQVAAAFGTGPVTVWRWDCALREHGVAGLVPARKGPKGPSKLSPELAEEIRELDGQGMTLDQIASGCGVSTFTVRNALGRVPARGSAPERPAAGEEPASPEPEPEAPPVLPDPLPREGDVRQAAQRVLRPGRDAGLPGVPGVAARAARGGRHPDRHRRGGAGAGPGPGAGGQDDPPQAVRAGRPGQGRRFADGDRGPSRRLPPR